MVAPASVILDVLGHFAHQREPVVNGNQLARWPIVRLATTTRTVLESIRDCDEVLQELVVGSYVGRGVGQRPDTSADGSDSARIDTMGCRLNRCGNRRRLAGTRYLSTWSLHALRGYDDTVSKTCTARAR